MGRKLPLAKSQAPRTACAPGLLRTGVVEKSGEVLAPAALTERVSWAADLVSGMATALLAEHWNDVDVDVLASGQDAGGRSLPSHAWMALRRLGWTTGPPHGVRVNDRIVRMAQEQSGRTLRSAKWRADLIAAVLRTWPGDPGKRTAQEWDAMRAAVADGQLLPSNVVKSRTRQITTFARKNHRMPVDVFELEPPPRMARTLLLSACDGQQATIERTDSPGHAILRLQLPTRPDPSSHRDWVWVACPVLLPPTVPDSAVLHLPTLRIHQGRVRVDLAYTHAVPKAARSGHTIALGVDWGLNTLLSAGAARLCDDGRITALGAGAQFRAAGVLAKQHRLRRLSEHLHAKADRYRQLACGDETHPLAAKLAALSHEIGQVSSRRSNLNSALSWAAARWAVDQAVAAGASVIYIEDLRSMEASGMGRTMNTRFSQQVRGQIVDRLRHLAAEAGIAVVTVPARGTSRRCPQCLTPLRHRKAPDRPTVAGWKWAVCPDFECGWQGDRDQGAWRRIAARGLTHQARTVLVGSRRTMAIRSVVDSLDVRAVITPATATGQINRNDRSKTGPTRRRTTRPAPRRRRAPSPTGLTGPAGQRPEGHAHTDRIRPLRAAHRNQDVNAISTPALSHRPRGAALGAGFHLHAHATPPKWADPVPDDPPGRGFSMLTRDASRPL
ncbi:zinc ribbon domain-containing protein [Streptomyces sp. NPDC102405]|uniref:zinc ribbon domain-containing protein n=1 Tax=Streptomyces sp. NPDC102405 TaxID=3366170 RepID=UPI0038291F68